MKILITAIGKRVQLIESLKSDTIDIIGVDSQNLIAGKEFVDKFFIIPKVSEDNYINEILKICKKEKVNLIIPLYEKEFKILCENRNKFKDIGTIIILSDENIIKICNNKNNTFEFFEKYNINTPNIIKDYNTKTKFPLIIKPNDGMGSDSVFKINNIKELKFFKSYVKNSMVQEMICGTEYTIDALCDLNGNIISIVPRERMKVRSGEVEKSKTIYDLDIINECKNVIDCLKKEGNVIGPLTIQCFKIHTGKIIFIEINPRFGGGVPLTFKAGVNYGNIFEKMFKNEEVKYINNFKEITMIRYDEAIFIED